MFDMATEGAAQLVNKCYLRYYKVKGLRSILTNDVSQKGIYDADGAYEIVPVD